MKAIILVLATAACLAGAAGAARADDRPRLISAFALTQAGDPPARVVEYYGAGVSRFVQQPKVVSVRRQPARG